MRHPEAMIIYVPNDGNYHLVGAHKMATGWKFSKWVINPESELNEFLGGCLNNGMFVLDVRRQANAQTPGMATATPILIANRGISIQTALEAAKLLHNAILQDDESSVAPGESDGAT